MIDQMFPWATTAVEGPPNPPMLDSGQSTKLAALVRLVQQIVQQIPNELLVLESARYGEFVASIAVIQDALRMWQVQRNTVLTEVPGLSPHHPVALVRSALALCPDEVPSNETAELSFVADRELRESLRIDISAVNNALSNGEWKAATVLAGSVIEALLLWALHLEDATKVTRTANSLVGNVLQQKPNSDLERWNLHEYIEVSAALDIISPDTAAQARLAKDFRNLIHPGRAARLGQTCNRGTAVSAVAAVEHAVQDLTP